MSYFNGITDAELREEGWSEDQIKELRRVEKATDEKRKAEAEKKFREDLYALNDRGLSIYADLTTGPIPWPREIAAAAARSSQEQVRRTGDFIYAPPQVRKWWQFWKR